MPKVTPQAEDATQGSCTPNTTVRAHTLLEHALTAILGCAGGAGDEEEDAARTASLHLVDLAGDDRGVGAPNGVSAAASASAAAGGNARRRSGQAGSCCREGCCACGTKFSSFSGTHTPGNTWSLHTAPSVLCPIPLPGQPRPSRPAEGGLCGTNSAARLHEGQPGAHRS